MMDYYKLDATGETPIRCNDWRDADECFSNIDLRRVKLTELNDGTEVSTVFLSMDHNYGEGDPVLWETMVFGGKHDGDMSRCSGTRTDALKMHEDMINELTNND